MAFGRDMFHNLMTYLAWAFDVRNAFFDEPGGISSTAWRVGLPILATLFALAWLTRRRTLLPAIGLVWAGLGIAPVLPLTHHTYATYLYTPLAGLALAAGAGIEALLVMVRARRGERVAREGARGGRALLDVAVAGTAAILLIAYSAASNALLGARVARRVTELDLPFDRQLRKSEMIRRATEGLRRTGTPRRLALYMPAGTSARLDQTTGRVYSDTTLRIEDMLMYRVLDEGRALRALNPGLDSVAFVRRWSAGYADFDLCGNTPAGDIVDFGRGPEAHLRLGQLLIESGRSSLAADLLGSACDVYPEDPRLRDLLQRARTARAAPIGRSSQ
jgi:hypothetical protein